MARPIRQSKCGIGLLAEIGGTNRDLASGRLICAHAALDPFAFPKTHNGSKLLPCDAQFLLAAAVEGIRIDDEYANQAGGAFGNGQQDSASSLPARAW